MDEMVDAVEADQSDENEIERDDIVQKPRHDQNQNAGGDDHGDCPEFGSKGAVSFSDGMPA
jgi:hypothetical protein